MIARLGVVGAGTMGAGIAQLGVLDADQADGAVALRGDGKVRHVIAFTPVMARPMISFWICEVPS